MYTAWCHVDPGTGLESLLLWPLVFRIGYSQLSFQNEMSGQFLVRMWWVVCIAAFSMISSRWQISQPDRHLPWISPGENSIEAKRADSLFCCSLKFRSHDDSLKSLIQSSRMAIRISSSSQIQWIVPHPRQWRPGDVDGWLARSLPHGLEPLKRSRNENLTARAGAAVPQ